MNNEFNCFWEVRLKNPLLCIITTSDFGSEVIVCEYFKWVICKAVVLFHLKFFQKVWLIQVFINRHDGRSDVNKLENELFFLWVSTFLTTVPVNRTSIDIYDYPIQTSRAITLVALAAKPDVFFTGVLAKATRKFFFECIKLGIHFIIIIPQKLKRRLRGQILAIQWRYQQLFKMW